MHKYLNKKLEKQLEKFKLVYLTILHCRDHVDKDFFVTVTSHGIIKHKKKETKTYVTLGNIKQWSASVHTVVVKAEIVETIVFVFEVWNQ